MIYYPALLRSGTLPSDGDSIAIPIFQDFITAAILAPIALTITWLCLRYYVGGAKLTIWQHDKPIRSALMTALFGVPALLWASMIIYSYIIKAWPLREYLWLLVFIPQILWLLVMRAAAVSQNKIEWLKADYL